MVQAPEASCASSALVPYGNSSEEEDEDEGKATDSYTLLGLVSKLYDDSQRQPRCDEGVDTTGALVSMVRTSCTTHNKTDFPKVCHMLCVCAMCHNAYCTWPQVCERLEQFAHEMASDNDSDDLSYVPSEAGDDGDDDEDANVALAEDEIRLLVESEMVPLLVHLVNDADEGNGTRTVRGVEVAYENNDKKRENSDGTIVERQDFIGVDVDWITSLAEGEQSEQRAGAAHSTRPPGHSPKKYGKKERYNKSKDEKK